MGGVVSAARGRGSWGLIALGVLALVLAGTLPARAVDLLEGQVQVHGYFETTVRGISRNFNEQLDMSQWVNVFRIDTDANLIQNPIGPLDSLRSYMRIEVRYDCVYTRACGLAPNVDVYGDRAAKLPDRLANAKTQTFDGVIPITPPTDILIGNRPGDLSEVNGFNVLFGQLGPSGILFGFDAPAQYTFKDYLDYRFAGRKTPGGADGLSYDNLGPWLPSNAAVPNAGLIHIANPFSTQDFNPILPRCGGGVPAGTCVPGNGLLGYGAFGSGALPYRPAPLLENTALTGNLYTAQGIYYPTPALVNYLNSNGSQALNAQYSQSDLAWNHTASQSETYEFKEGYLHAEFGDGRAWLRIGKQLIVWGKTELFATTDQFNPRNDALSSLPSLEESRIPLWAARAVYNFYSVGPFEDVRLEGALNLDKFTPDDIGVCGMPYAVNAVCDKAFGIFAHGTTGVGVAGQTSPPNWWQSTQGLQGGVRLEFRWDRYSFALVDIYNYVRLPYTNRLSTYSRNVDPNSGLPLAMGATGPCNLTGFSPDPALTGQPVANGSGSGCLTPASALQFQSVNQTLFAMICSTTVGFSSLDRTACAQSVLGSSAPAAAGLTVSQVLSHLLAGDPILNAAAFGLLGAAHQLPLVALKPGIFQTLSNSLSSQQQALLGCGPFYHTVCDGGFNLAGKPIAGGIDLLNMEASVVTQSFIGFEGTFPGMLANNTRVAQPGTVGFQGGPVGTRFVPGSNTLVILPGARGPGDPGFSTAIDPATGKAIDSTPAIIANMGYIGLGFPFNKGQPFTGQTFKSMMAAVSWNLEMILVTTSTSCNSNPAFCFHGATEMSPTVCSWINPSLCSTVQSFMTVTGTLRPDIRAGGNGQFGRRDFVWDSGGEVNLQYQRRNVLGFSMDFAEDVTKSNWGIEFGWEQHLPFTDNNVQDGITKSDDLELSVSVDRPTFINFLNQNRTFFFNSQFFFSYLTNYHTSFNFPGPFGVLGTFTISTGYFQDRLLPSLTFVYDVFSNSGAALPEIQYRFTENFSFTLGVAQFLGRFRGQTMPINPIATVGQNTGSDAYKTFSEPGLSLIRDRDEAYFKLRYTF